ncbi:unnamed protein product [Arctia plantaginis]|uniref:Uncharacterized protein n=1 Tax=Arctia plantaginis TaxID=874455 RepID=A0A8S1ACE0_ARCPL|nr:unnamed protein product [Arctia plantaginis]
MARVRALRRSSANWRAAPPAHYTQGWPEGSAEVGAESSPVKVRAAAAPTDHYFDVYPFDLTPTKTYF